MMTSIGALIVAFGLFLLALAIVPEVSRRRPALPPAMQYPAFRSFWLGMLASVGGFQILRFGQFWLIFELTGSPLALGYVGLANGVPAIFLNLFGGVAADRMDQRRLIYTTQTITASLIFLLAAITFMGVVEVWHLLTISFLAGAVEAFDQPARRALMPQLIDRKVMSSAVALNSSIWPGTRIGAPALAGFIIALRGTEACFFVAGVGFLVMAAVTYRLRVPRVTRTSSGSPARELFEGLNFIRKESMFSFLIAMTFFNSFFGNSYITLMPMFAVDVLEVGADKLGLLMGAGGIGSLATSIWLSTRTSLDSKGLLIMGSGILSGVAIAAFALTAEIVGSLSLAMALMLTIGVFNSLFTTATQTSLQMMVPDHIRGRVMGFYGMTYNIRPLGGMQAGALANVGAIGAPFAIAMGGMAVVAFAVGSAMVSTKVRNLSTLLRQAETAAASASRSQQPAPTAAND
jgi:MFS family permease